MKHKPRSPAYPPPAEPALTAEEIENRQIDELLSLYRPDLRESMREEIRLRRLQIENQRKRN